MSNLNKVAGAGPSQLKTTPCIKIGSYDILGSIGQGNFSVCKLAKSRLTNQMMAIKCIVKKNVDSMHLARIYREIEIMKSLDHPNIIKLNQVGQKPNNFLAQYTLGGISKNGPKKIFFFPIVLNLGTIRKLVTTLNRKNILFLKFQNI